MRTFALSSQSIVLTALVLAGTSCSADAGRRNAACPSGGGGGGAAADATDCGDGLVEGGEQCDRGEAEASLTGCGPGCRVGGGGCDVAGAKVCASGFGSAVCTEGVWQPDNDCGAFSQLCVGAGECVDPPECSTPGLGTCAGEVVLTCDGQGG